MKLQDAIDNWDAERDLDGNMIDITPIVEAARRVANPDEATERILDRMGMHEHTQRDWDKAYELALAALGVTEAPDGQ